VPILGRAWPQNRRETAPTIWRPLTQTKTGGALGWQLGVGTHASGHYVGVMVDTTASAVAGTTSPYTWNHTVASGCSLLLAGIAVGGTAAATGTASCTFAGQTMTLVARVGSGGAAANGLAILYALASPPSGTGSVSFTHQGTAFDKEGGSASFLGSGTLPAGVAASGTTGQPAISLTNTPDGSLCVDLVVNGSPIIAPTAGQTQFWRTNNNGGTAGGNGGMSDKPGGGGATVSMGWSASADFWGEVAVTIPYSAGTTPVPPPHPVTVRQAVARAMW